MAAAACGTPVETAEGLPPTITPTESAGPGLPSPSPTSAVLRSQAPTIAVEDPSLLSIFPGEIAGHPIVTEEGQFAAAVEHGDFAAMVEAAAFGTVVGEGDLASGVVAQLIAGRFTDEFFRDWRDSYDEGACAQAGGVAGNAETELGGRTVYIGTCAGGLRTYHAWLEDRNVIVSLFSVGEGRYGEQLMAGLRP